ncbi:hypothetical protein P691DRAFT_809718 [Macrolepiota fuliginosa MF-IS2]|uniref:Uncharacterized protein n=1 Tax=Macrolepiota fuliginosa MF-IS2 TaxID=1400762 RepID=A0A9P5XHA7_9AGAR|nr:hypothetical protein P691DRAFT_809718 [Macrolepiota fuliginosa MF-IS2]
MIVDALLIVILLALSMADVGLSFMTERTKADLQMSQNLYTAYISFFLVVVVDIAVSSVALYIRSRHSLINDHNTSLCISFIVSPLFVIYALFPIVALGLQKSGVLATTAQWDLSNLVVDCITEFIIIATCLRFGMPAIPKKGVEEKHHHKEYQA